MPRDHISTSIQSDGAASTFVGWRDWRDRLAVAGGALPDRVRYTRKSTVAEGRQVASHAQQNEAMDAKWGPIPTLWVWQDSQSGTTFDRPAFQDLLDFCRRNRRAKRTPGRIEMYDPTRFGRILDEDGAPDPAAWQAIFTEIEATGWQVHFVTPERSGDVLVQVIQLAVQAYAAGEFSAKLSRTVRRGRVSHARHGWWTNGAAPWGTRRQDTLTARILAPGERSTAGGGGVVLVPDEPTLALWNRAARLVMGGASLDEVGVRLWKEGVRGPRGGRMSHSAVKNFLTNPALAGRVVFKDEPDEQGRRVTREVTAKWRPMVDVALFDQLCARLGAHGRLHKQAQRRKKRQLYPLQATCAHCALPYVGGRLSAKQGEPRVYQHANPKLHENPEAHAARAEAGCKVWCIDAESLERTVVDLIALARCSPEYVEAVKVVLADGMKLQAASEATVDQARRQLAAADAEYGRLARMAARIGDDDGAFVEQAKAAKQRREAAAKALQAAERDAERLQHTRVRIEDIVVETRTMVAAWDRLAPEERAILLDYWVLGILVFVEPVPGRRRLNRKYAVVELRSVPGPIVVELDQPGGDSGLGGDSSASSSSRRTGSSASSSRRARSASRAASVPSRPNAHAACERTIASESDSADTSAGTSSGSPTLPSTTAALRRSPGSFARFMGEPENASVYAVGDIVISSSASDRASRPSRKGRGAKGEPSRRGRANLRGNGQTL